MKEDSTNLVEALFFYVHFSFCIILKEKFWLVPKIHENEAIFCLLRGELYDFKRLIFACTYKTSNP